MYFTTADLKPTLLTTGPSATGQASAVPNLGEMANRLGKLINR